MTTTASIRLAREEDFNRITEMVAEAFLHDPVYNYFASLKELIPTDRETQEKDNLRKWARFLLLSCVKSGGRVTVVVEHSSETPERVVGVANWLPPNKRLALWHVRTLINAGIIGMLKAWGLSGLLRCGFGWLDVAHNALVKGFRKKSIQPEDPDATWYLQLIAVAPETQGKGYCSQLIREGFGHAPGEVFTLDATTAVSRDKYAHIGFELIETIVLGKGKSNDQGLAAGGKSAVGVTAYSMVKVLNKGKEGSNDARYSIHNIHANSYLNAHIKLGLGDGKTFC